MPAEEKPAPDHAPGQVQSQDVLEDKGRGNMVSENEAANDRFERNSPALQQERHQPPAPAPQQQTTMKELSFGPDRQPGRNLGQLKAEQAKATGQEQGPQPGKKELSFGADRQPGRNLNQLKADQAKATDKDQSQQQGEKKGLSFGPDRGPGQARSPGLGHGR